MAALGFSVPIRDAYQIFFEQYLPKEQLFQFGLDEIICCSESKVEAAWQELKHRALNNETVYMRGFGRNASGSHLFQELYKRALGNSNVQIDPTNNAKPTAVLKEFTGYSKTPNRNFNQIRNYQVSHVFGRTKNIFAFMAPWNIVYIPKIVDPFTGHEAKGEAVKEFTAIFQKEVYGRFSKQIDDFNRLMGSSQFIDKIASALEAMESSGNYEHSQISILYKGVQSDFPQIQVET